MIAQPHGTKKDSAAMVRTYQRKTSTKYSQEELKAAVKAVKEDMKILAAAKKFGVPRSTVFDHLKEIHPKIGAGAPTILTPGEEKEIVITLQVLQQIGFGLTKELVGVVVRDYLNDQPLRRNPFHDGIPGKDWWKLFLKRWASQLSIRKPQHLPTHRAAGSSPEVMDEWFQRVESLFQSSGLIDLPFEELKCRIWNCDETGFCTASAAKKVIAKRGDRDVQETLGGSGRDYITVLGAGCADGTRLQPYVLYKGKNLWGRWMQGGPAGCMYSVSDSGWMEASIFLQWFEKMFLPSVRHLTSTAPVISFFDGHHSHMSIRLVELARSNNVHLVCLPPHTTHLLQPLDVGVFGPMKAAWRTILKQHQLQGCAATVTKQEFHILLAKLWDQSFLPQHLKSGFRRTGLCPLSRAAIPSSRLTKALPFSRPPPTRPMQPQPAETSSSHSEAEEQTAVTIELVGTYTVESTVTPVRLQLTGYFSQLIKKNKENTTKARPDKRKVKPRFYGEALTLDEVYERLREEEREKEEQKKQKEEAKKKKEAKKRGTKKTNKRSGTKVAMKKSGKSPKTSKAKRKRRKEVSSNSTSTSSDNNISKASSSESDEE